MASDSCQLALFWQVDFVTSKDVDEVLSALDVNHRLQLLHLFGRLLNFLGHVNDVYGTVSLPKDLSRERPVLGGLEPDLQVTSAVITMARHFNRFLDVLDLGRL